MTEASLHYDGEPREGGEDDRANLSVRSSEFRVTPSRSSAEVGDIGNEAVMAAPAKKPERKVRSSKNSKKASLEDQMEERMRSSIETRFSSFEEKMLGMMADFQRQQKSVNSSLTATSTVTNNVCSAQRSTSGACQPTVTRTNTLGAGNGRRNVISLDNSLNDEQFGSRSPVQRDWPDDDDILSLQPGQGESRDLDLDSHSNASEQQKIEDDTSDRFLKYKSDENVSEETRQVLLDLFGEDACVKKAGSGTGIVLDKTQTDILNQSWRISAPDKLTAYRDAYKNSLPVHEKSEDILKVPSLDDIVEHFLIKRFSGKATFKHARTLFSQNWKEMEKLAFKGQSSAHMGIVITLYIQQALAALLQQLQQDSPNLDSMTQTVRDSFAMSSKVLDQLGRTGAFHHYIRRKATILDMGLENVKDVAKQADLLPLTGDGVLGSEFENKLKLRKEKNKEYKDLVPEVTGKQNFAPKRKAPASSNSQDQKQMRFENNKSNRNYSHNKPEYSTPLKYGNNYKSTGSYGQRFGNQQKKGVSSFRARTQSK